MTAPLYARYIPPKPKPTSSEGVSAAAGRAVIEDRTIRDSVAKPAKRKRYTPEADGFKKSKQAKTGDELARPDAVALEQNANGQEGLGQPVDAIEKATGAGMSGLETLQREPHTKNPKRWKDKRPSAAQVEADTADTADHQRHTSVISKYQKSVRAPYSDQEAVPNEQAEPEEQADQVRELKPFERPKREAQGPPLNAIDVLPSWISRPVRVKRDASVAFADLDLHQDHVKLLQRKGLERALPVQSAVLPLLLPTPKQHPGDMCVSAATGSGKTLAYVLPIVQSLVKRPGPGLRAVVVVPTRELVKQVKDTFDAFMQGTGLRVQTASGVQHLKDEQAAIVGQELQFDEDKLTESRSHAAGTAHSGSGEESEDEDWDILNDPTREEPEILPYHTMQYFSKTDILIATPGRLVDHVKQTKGFSLGDLEWLVIDEADRLLDASFQDWVATITDALAEGPPAINDKRTSWLLRMRPDRHTVRKVMLSATMTRDLQKLASLKLRNPRLVLVEGSEASEDRATMRKRDDGAFVLPVELVEYGVPVGDGSEKPLHLLRLLERILETGSSNSPQSQARTSQAEHHDASASDTSTDSNVSSDLSDSDASSVLSDSSTSSIDSASHRHNFQTSPITPPAITQPNAIIFTAATDTATRLATILKHLRSAWSSQVASITKSGTSSATTKAIARFQAGKLRILIATDRVSRGLDLPNLSNVINYDIPHSVNSYVHRVGRTARAGNAGTAWTLLEDRQARWYWKEEIATRAKIERGGKSVGKIRMDVRDEMREGYVEALRQLEQKVKGS